MVFLYPLLLLIPLILGVFISLSATNWLVAWIGLELSLLTFIPLMAMTSSMDSLFKYFMIQATASLMIMQSCLVSMNSAHILCLILALKAGVAPLHFWLPPLGQDMTWFSLFILLTAQKIAPLWLLASLTPYYPLLLFLVWISAVLGSLGGLNSNSLRKILIFSSITHMAWVLAGLHSYMVWGLYFLTYLGLSWLFFYQMMNPPVYSLTKIAFPKIFTVSVALLTLGGLPPMIGFLGKWLILYSLNSGSWVTSIILISSSSITLYFYLKIALSLMVKVCGGLELKVLPQPSFSYFFVALAPMGWPLLSLLL